MKLIFISILLLTLLGCSDKQSQTKVEDSSNDLAVKSSEKLKKTILFFGNSLTAGYGLDISEAFPARIQQIIDSTGLKYEVINAGLSGETTASGSSRIDWVLKNKIDVFVLELGANDGLRGIPTEETEKNLQEIINRVKSKYQDVTIVLAGMMVPPNMGEEYSKSFMEVFPRLAEKNEIPFIPFLLEGVAGEPELNLEDGIHPTAIGHGLVAQNVWKVLKSVL
jgi:acyl-CoA thioesterase-1